MLWKLGENNGFDIFLKIIFNFEINLDIKYKNIKKTILSASIYFILLTLSLSNIFLDYDYILFY